MNADLVTLLLPLPRASPRLVSTLLRRRVKASPSVIFLLLLLLVRHPLPTSAHPICSSFSAHLPPCAALCGVVAMRGTGGGGRRGGRLQSLSVAVAVAARIQPASQPRHCSQPHPPTISYPDSSRPLRRSKQEATRRACERRGLSDTRAGGRRGRVDSRLTLTDTQRRVSATSFTIIDRCTHLAITSSLICIPLCQWQLHQQIALPPPSSSNHSHLASAVSSPVASSLFVSPCERGWRPSPVRWAAHRWAEHVGA